jgi:hypothetical protein
MQFVFVGRGCAPLSRNNFAISYLYYRCHFHRFIGILIDEAFPKSITDYIQCKDLLLKYFRAEDIETLDNRLAGISKVYSIQHYVIKFGSDL